MIGYVGHGKSSLVNNVCQAQQLTGFSRKNITKNVFKGRCVFPKNGLFHIFDVPGISKFDNYASLILRRVLQFMKWNMIFIQVKLENRYENMI